MADPARTGRCLCGGISFTTHGPLRPVIDCHCHRCRRWSGHHVAATSTALADLVLVDPDGLLRWHEVPGAAYGFCSRCGSSLFWRSDEPDRMSVCAGVLDPPTGLVTEQALFVSEASDYHVRQDVPEHATE
jgi:hypothetical protein